MLRSYPRHRGKSPQSHTITESQDRQSEVSTRSSCVSHTVLDHTHTHAQCWQVPRARTDVPPSFISSRNAASSIIARLSRCSPIITLLFNVGYSLCTHFSPSSTVARRRVSDFPSLSLSLSLSVSQSVCQLETWYMAFSVIQFFCVRWIFHLGAMLMRHSVIDIFSHTVHGFEIFLYQPVPSGPHLQLPIQFSWRPAMNQHNIGSWLAENSAIDRSMMELSCYQCAADGDAQYNSKYHRVSDIKIRF